MGVRTTITLHAPSQEAARAAADAAFARIERVDEAASDYRRDSEAMRLCASGEAVAGPDLWALLVAAREVWRQSGGAFDVTLGPLSRLWREARATGRLPDAGRVGRARASCGMDRVELDAASRRVRLLAAGMVLDFGGIAKGYAAQRAVETLREHGCGRCLVALAGDLAAGEAPPGQGGWRVALSEGPGLASHGTILLACASVSTSGGAEQFVEIEGRRYAHIVDPATGLGVVSCRAATVLSRRGELADAWATALCAGAKRPDGGEGPIWDPENLLRLAEDDVSSAPASRPMPGSRR